MDRKTIKNALISSFVAFCWLISAKNAQAITTPNFPSCVNPSGSLIVNYSSGNHAIPGSSTSYSGTDKVYNLGDGNFLQCLCTVNSTGIQTGWWKVGSLTEDELNKLRADNWFLIPDGSLWGLDKNTYMAKNWSYSCNGSSSSTSSSNSSDGQVQGTSTRFGQVLGLATTGTLPVIVSYLGLGLVLLLASRLLKK